MNGPPEQVTAILIAGPTASGKSALAVRVAERLGGVVINADSMQVYRDLRILTARPTHREEARAPHRLFGEVDGAVNYSLGKWVAAAEGAIASARGGGRLPILVGGTGLYFKALTQGLAAIPVVPDEVRRRIRRDAEGMTPQALHARLAVCDPETAAGVRPTDPQRVLRGLEVFHATGVPLARYRAATAQPVLAPASWVGIFLAPHRPCLAARIEARFDAMIAAGGLDEAAGLAARRLDPSLPVMRAHGVPGLIAHLAGEIGLAAAVAAAKLDTRHYVKRQFTFARHQLPDFTWTAPADAEAHLLRAMEA